MNVLGTPKVCQCLRRGLALWVLCGTGLLRAQSPYAEKPAWWDAAEAAVPLIPRDSLEASYTATRDQALNSFRVNLMEWLFLGPFPADKGLETALPPDQERRFHPNARFQDADGNTLTWRNLQQTRQESPNVFRSENVIYYFANAMDLERPGRVWMVPAHTDGVEITIQGEQVYRETRALGSDLSRPVPLTLEAGRNLLQVKLHQSRRNWNLTVDMYRVNPRLVDMIALTRALRHLDPAQAPGWSAMAQRLAGHYYALGDGANALHWEFYRYPLLGAAEKQNLISAILRRAANEPEFGWHADAFFERLPAMDESVELILAHLQLLEGIGDPARLRQRLMESLPALRGKDALEADLWMLNLHIREGDAPAARQLVRALQAREANLQQNRRFRDLENRLLSLRAGEVQLARDWDFDSQVRQAGQVAQEDPAALPPFIRRVLLEKSGAVIPSAEPTFFPGALAAYRKAFSEYSQVYETDLRGYMTLLDRQLRLSPLQRARALQQVSLRPPDLGDVLPPPPPPSPNAFALPDMSRMHPVYEMNPESRMFWRSGGIFSQPLQAVPPASIATQGGLTLLQNSRTLAAMRDGALLWRHVWGNSRLQLPDNITPWHQELTPLIDQDQAFARVLVNGAYELVAADLESGTLQWTWSAGGKILCTNPVVWGGEVMVVTRTTGQISRYDLVFLDRRSGRVEAELFLVSTTHTVAFNFLNARVEMDHYMPAPVLADNALYLQTNNGVLVAVDLLTRSFLWIRTYVSGSAFTQQNVRNLEGRRFTSPLVFGDVVVFSPVDAQALFSVQRDSGALLTRQGSFIGADVRPFGDSLLILDREGGAQQLNPRTFAPIRSLPGTGYRHLAPLKDGAILQTGNELQVWSAGRGLLSRQALPAGFTPIALTPSRIYSYRNDEMNPMVFSSMDPKRPAPAAVKDLPGERSVRQGLWRPGEERMYLITEDTVFAYAGPGAPDWSAPHGHSGAPERIRLFEAGDWVYLVESHRVQVLQRGNGRRIHLYPEIGGGNQPIRLSSLFADTLHIVTSAPNGFDLVSIRGNTAQTLANYGNTRATPMQILSPAPEITVYLGENLEQLRWHEADKRWEEVNTTHIGRGRERGWGPVGNQQVAWPGGDRLNWLDEKGAWMSLQVEGAGRQRQSRPAEQGALHQSLFSWRSGEDRWQVVDMERKADLTGTLNSQSRPVILGNKAYGLSSAGGASHSMVPWSLDTAGGKVETLAPVPLQNRARGWENVSRERFSFAHRNNVYSLLIATNRAGEAGELPMLRLDTDTNEVTVFGFPNPGGIRDARIWKDTLWMTWDQGHLLLPMTEFVKLPDGAPLLSKTLPPPADLRIDGFPLEWSPAQLREMERGQPAASWNGTHLVLAGRIRNQEFIRALGRGGMDSRVSLHLFRGTEASFTYEKAKTLPFSDLGGGIEFAYTVPPTGEELFFELALTRERLKSLDLDPEQLLRHPGRDTLGDIAFDFTLRSPMGHPIHALSTRPWPVWFPRFLLTAPSL